MSFICSSYSKRVSERIRYAKYLTDSQAAVRKYSRRPETSFKMRLQQRYFCVKFAQFFKKAYLQNISTWPLLLISSFQPRFYSLFTLFSFFLHFFPFYIDNCNYKTLFRKGIKMRIFLLFTIIYPNVNMNVV